MSAVSCLAQMVQAASITPMILIPTKEQHGFVTKSFLQKQLIEYMTSSATGRMKLAHLEQLLSVELQDIMCILKEDSLTKAVGIVVGEEVISYKSLDATLEQMVTYINTVGKVDIATLSSKFDLPATLCVQMLDVNGRSNEISCSKDNKRFQNIRIITNKTVIDDEEIVRQEVCSLTHHINGVCMQVCEACQTGSQPVFLLHYVTEDISLSVIQRYISEHVENKSNPCWLYYPGAGDNQNNDTLFSTPTNTVLPAGYIQLQREALVREVLRYGSENGEGGECMAGCAWLSMQWLCEWHIPHTTQTYGSSSGTSCYLSPDNPQLNAYIKMLEDNMHITILVTGVVVTLSAYPQQHQGCGLVHAVAQLIHSQEEQLQLTSDGTPCTSPVLLSTQLPAYLNNCADNSQKTDCNITVLYKLARASVDSGGGEGSRVNSRCIYMEKSGYLMNIEWIYMWYDIILHNAFLVYTSTSGGETTWCDGVDVTLPLDIHTHAGECNNDTAVVLQWQQCLRRVGSNKYSGLSADHLPAVLFQDMWDVFKRVCVRVYAHFHCWRAYHQQFHYQYPIIPSQSWELVRDGYWVILWKELLVASSAVAKLEAGSGYKRSDAVRRLVEEIGSSSTGSGSGRHKHAHTHTHQHLLDMAASAGTAPLHTFILLNRGARLVSVLLHYLFASVSNTPFFSYQLFDSCMKKSHDARSSSAAAPHEQQAQEMLRHFSKSVQGTILELRRFTTLQTSTTSTPQNLWVFLHYLKTTIAHEYQLVTPFLDTKQEKVVTLGMHEQQQYQHYQHTRRWMSVVRRGSDAALVAKHSIQLLISSASLLYYMHHKFVVDVCDVVEASSCDWKEVLDPVWSKLGVLPSTEGKRTSTGGGGKKNKRVGEVVEATATATVSEDAVMVKALRQWYHRCVCAHCSTLPITSFITSCPLLEHSQTSQKSKIGLEVLPIPTVMDLSCLVAGHTCQSFWPAPQTHTHHTSFDGAF